MHFFPGIKEPTPSATWSLDKLNDDPQYRKLDRLVETVEQGLTTCTPAEAAIWVLDWQHTSYRVRPDLMFESGRSDWPLSPYPDGDYYIYLAEDFTFGSFGHPWEHTLCLFGTPLLDAAEDSVNRILGPPVRRDGQPTHAG